MKKKSLKKGCKALLLCAALVALQGCGIGNGSAGTGKAQADENGNYVINGSFEEPDFTGWEVTNVDNVTEELDIYTRETDCCDGVQSLHFYSGSSDVNFTAQQTISGLEEGSYRLAGQLQGEAAGDDNAAVYLYAVVNGETLKAEVDLSGYLNWQTAELSGLTPDNGEITIGVSVSTAPGGWGTIDQITLVKE